VHHAKKVADANAYWRNSCSMNHTITNLGEWMLAKINEMSLEFSGELLSPVALSMIKLVEPVSHFEMTSVSAERGRNDHRNAPSMRHHGAYREPASRI
jgi:hypothetical protein